MLLHVDLVELLLEQMLLIQELSIGVVLDFVGLSNYHVVNTSSYFIIMLLVSIISIFFINFLLVVLGEII